MGTILRGEKPGDEHAIRELIRGAFPTDQEALLVDQLRQNHRLSVSLVAEVEGAIAGHIAFSPVTIKSANTGLLGAGLAPLAVLAQCRRRGISAQLVRASA